MKTIILINKKLTKLELILFFSFVFSTAQGHSELPSDEYYQQNISTDLPSESYHNANLRSGWDEDGGPGGVGEGENSGVGVPVGDGVVAIIIATIIYSAIAILKKRKQIKCVK